MIIVDNSTIFTVQMLYSQMKEKNKNNENTHIAYMAIGCRVSQAYRKMLNQLEVSLSHAGLDITSNEYLVLRAIYHKEGLQSCEIAELTGKDKATVSRCVAILEKKGYIRTESISHKCLRVYSSERGKELQPLILKVAEERYNALLHIITPDELATFSCILDKILSSDN